MVQNQDQFNIFLEVAGEVAATAEQAQERVNYGKLTIDPRFMQWFDTDGSRTTEDVDGDTFRHLPKRERSVELRFNIDIQEFNPDLEFTYDRKVMIGSTDWHKIFKPGAELVFGKGAVNEKNLGETINGLQSKYVCIADVLQAPTKKNPDPEYKTMKLLQVFESREACYAAHQERFGGSGGELSEDVAGDFPEGWDAESWTHVEAEITKLIEDLPTPIGPRKVATNKLTVLLEKEYGIKPGWLETQL